MSNPSLSIVHLTMRRGNKRLSTGSGALADGYRVVNPTVLGLFCVR